PRDLCLHEAFSAQALRTPDALAVICREEQLTFRELEVRSNQLAHRLVKRGVGPDVRVVLCVERSVEAHVGILGTLKAGGAYVPIDPSYPREWLAHVLTDTGAPVVLTQQRLRDSLPPHSAHTLCLDSDAADLALESHDAPVTSVTPEHLAYIIYTSGSTGRPKGVMIQHRSVLNLRVALAATVHADARPGERVSVNAPLSFDASVKQLIQVLDGHTLCIVPDEARADVGELVNRIEKDALDVLDCSPAHLRLLVDEGLLERTAVPHRVLVGGEAVDPATWRHLAQAPRPRVFNVYGPTECTVDATACAFDASPTPTIGRPLPNVRVYVLDRTLRPVPIGVAGELFIGGEGVARGYLNRPELTADRFIPDAFSSTPGARLYRTGDVVRWRADGMLDYLGRADFQVKVRGFRIELGEIEAALLKHPQVHAAVVLAREDIPGDKRLVAYVVPPEGTQAAPTSEALRDWLKQLLPEHMRPSALLVLEALPLNTNGKVDRKALPAPQGTALASTYVAPRTPTEEQLAALFTQVLRVERVGVHDDFFALGGHSLLATQLVSRVRATFRMELPLRALFEAPTVATLAERLQSQTPSLRLPPLTRTQADGPQPLSFAQQRLWFLDQLTPGDASYNIPTALRLTGQVDVESLRRAFEALVARHDALRTTFRDVEGQATQHIHPPGTWALPLIDLSTLPEAQREDEAQRKVETDARQPFDLRNGPLLRTALVRLTAEEHLLLVTMHHIVSDGWSMGVLVRELVAFYEAFSTGQAPALAPLPVQYTDFAAWQRDWLQGETLDAQLGYWKQQLSGAPATLELPTDHPRPAIQSHAGATHAVRIPQETSEALKALAQREGATPFMVLLAAWQVFLSRYAGQDDITVGSPIAGRTQAEAEGLIGFFVNTLVLRARVTPEDSFRQLLAQVRGTTLAAYEHQHVPFEKLVEVLQPVRDASRSPLFQVMFVLQNAPGEALRVPGLTFRQVVAEGHSAKFDLTLTLQDSPQGFTGWMEYSTALFERSTIERMGSHLRTLLEAVAAKPEQPVAGLSLLSSEERQRVLVEWNDTAVASPTDVPVHVHFARQAQRTPEAVALVLGDATLTYAQLDSRANQLAHHLWALGIAPGARVGIAVERSFELVTALLAVLKVGAAFVPVDRNAPVERIEALLEDADVSVTLAHQPFASLLPSTGTRVWLDAQSAEIAARPTHAPEVRVEGEALAYVMFTSGSTGRPKGVSVPHRGITRLVLGSTFMRFGPDEVWLQAAPVAFDASTLEIWGALLHGAKLVLAPPHSLSLEELAAQLRHHHVTSLWLTAALFEQMALHQGEALAGVRQVLAGGDVLPAARVREHLARLPEGATFLNGYGPTENTTFSTTFAMHRDSVVGGSVSIGRPLSNSTVYVLDASLCPVPVGVAGEVYVGGQGLAWGYLNRPELTAERFVPHPFASTPGERLYRTGDKARWKEDGTLDFLGRVDFQVKVRGFRIELGEVEAVLRSATGVNEAIVVARGTDADKRLIGYVTASVGHSLDTDALKAGLKQHLPEYMVPSAVMVLDALPLNANGKVDRKALPEPEESTRAAAYVAPRTATEKQLAALYSEVLRVERVGLHDDFFALGGHSLLATQLVSRVRATLGLELPLRTLFDAPTVAALALKLADARPAAARGTPPLRPASRTGAIPLSFAQQRLWFLDQLTPGDASYNIPSALRLKGPVDVASLRRAFESLVARHESLRTTFHEHEGQATQHIHLPDVWTLPLVDLSALPDAQREAEAQRRIAKEANQPFHLERGPLLRTTLVRLAEEDHFLLVTMHHIVSDGWSMGVLVRELVAFYEAFTSGQTPTLAPLPVQYADFAERQRQWLQGEALDAQLGYWKQQLAGAAFALELPTDHPRPAIQSHQGAAVSVRIPQETSEALKALAQREGATPFMVLLAAFQVLLSRYSAQDDITVGSPIAGRTQAETEGLIGFFVNTLVLRTRVAPEDSFRQLLAQVRGTTLAAYEHQHLPFEKLVEVLQPVRDASRSPLFQVMFALQNAPAGDLRVRGLTFQQVVTEGRSAKFDLNLAMQDSPQGFVGSLEYSTALFKRGTLERMARQWLTLLEAVAARPEQSVADLSLLSNEERRRILVEWNDTTVASPTDVPVHVHFSRQAQRAPEAIALVLGEASLTYAQLDARANQLAHHLRDLGIQPGARVGLAVERSFELVAALLAILKVGATYVPVDRNAPVERIASLLEDADVHFVVTHQPFASLLPATGTRVWLDAQRDVIATRPTHAPDVRVDGEAMAYVMFTSGSTGRPKGVCIPHRGITRMVLGSTFMRFGADEVWLQVAPIAFDASTLEIWGALLNGSKLVLAPPHSLSLEDLAAQLRHHGVTTLFLTTALFEQMALHQGEALAGVRQILSGGDVLPADRVREHLARIPEGASFHNAYGPTENTTLATTFAMGHGSRVEGAIPIGRPPSNSTVYVLDAHLHPVPVGIAGEVYVGGQGLAWGYLHRPDLTAERFIPHPFASIPGERLYRTGDQARWREDGTLDFLGRVDLQVKVRGFRIELGEIETALRSTAGVNEAVVVARGTGADKRLIGYVTARAGHTPTPDTLRAGLKQRLPEYMVPSAFVVLDALPLNANGKVDRKALPEPGNTPRSTVFVAPRTAAEEQLATLFAEVLRVERIGVRDDFFAMGGHSLLATQLVSRVRSTFRVELPLRALFEAPTVEGLAPKLEEARSAGLRAPPLRPMPREGAIPLSFAQQRLWLLDQLQPGDISYNIPTALRLTGPVDVESLRRAFEALVERHESLRTTLSTSEEEPSQCIQEPAGWELPLIDLTSLPESRREEEAQRVAATEARRAFDLTAGPLLRSTLVRLGQDSHLLLVTMHHIVSDGWSMGVLVREVAAFYEAFVMGQWPSLPPLPVQYADFAVWQRGWLQGEALDAQLGYWKKQLGGAPSALELPTDRPRPPVQSRRGATVDVRIPLEISQALKALAQDEGATPFMLLLAAWQLLLARYSTQDDISVGTPIAGRTQAETEGLIGFFVNTLVLRAQVDPRATFREFLAQVRRTTLAAYEHQHLPFEKLVEVLHPVRDLSRSALFQAMFSLQNAPTETLRVSGLSFQSVPVDTRSSKFDLTLTLGESPQGFVGLLTYATDLFDASTAHRMSGHLGVLLEAIAAQPDSTLASLPLLTAPERQRLLVDWNGPNAEFPRDLCLHDAFSAQALRTPDALAVICREEQLTFRELDTRANQLAHRLVKLGVGPDVRVVLCVERSVEALVGILGTLKAGGAYVPIDPSYPREWLAHVLTDTGAPVVLTQQRLRDSLPPHSAHTLCLDSDAANFSREPSHAPVTSVTPEHLAYIIYTSGSTGRPKGVMIQHRSVLNLRVALAATVHADARPGERVSVNAPLSFDASVKQLIQVLDGHTLCIVPDEARADVAELVNRIGQDALDVLDCSPAHLRLLVDEGLLERTAVPHRVLVGGEAVDPATWRHLAQAPRPRVFNVYGPTECTVDATACAFDASPTPTIGRPLPNVRVYVLDRTLRPVPIGVAGELFIGGEGVARGYLNRPELTADRFIPDAFSSAPGARLYRTGDVVRWRADGMLDYLGRADFQVKVRGFRIELGEIESRLLGHPAVHQAVVLVREDVPGDKRLVAYLVPEAGESLDSTELRTFLKQHLPEYMVPSAFLVLEALPLNTNGKVDRKALPAPQGSTLASTYVAPRTPAEEQLAALFTQVLRVERVGVHDDFFALGGHSLLATQLVSRVRATFRVELPLRVLFESPTVATLAERLQTATPNLHLPAPTQMHADGPRPLSFAQQRLWLLDQLQPGDASYNIPTALQLSGQLDVESLRRAFEALIQRHEALRTTFHQHQDQPIQTVHAPSGWALPLVDLSARPEALREEEARRMADEEARRPFDLARGPLLRSTLVRLAKDSHLLLVTMHHIVSDGWSMGVLVREVATFYAAFSTGRSPSLPPLPVQYADFAAWQRTWLQGEALDAQIHYWKQQLSGAPPALELPTDHPRPPVQSHRGDSVDVRIPKRVADGLKALSQREGATPFMTLLAAFQVLLSRYSAQDDISVGTPIAGRTQAETEGLIGFFINTLVLRAQLNPRATFRELLTQVRGTTLAAYDHQHLPFEKLVEAVQPSRDLSRSPLFQAMFVLQNTPTEALRLPGLSFQALPLEAHFAKFDLSLGLREGPDGFVGSFDFATDLFDAATIQRMAGHFGVLLEAIAKKPDTRLSDLPLLTNAERQQLLVEWNPPASQVAREPSIPAMVEAQVRRTPDAVAVITPERRLTYRELDAKANQLAHRLRGLGVGPEVRVGLCVERTEDLVIGALGILKAGGAYVPLDPSYPRERLGWLLEDAQGPALVAHSHLLSALPETSATPVCLDSDVELVKQPTTAPTVDIHPGHLAYLIYTSGSTGRPKGVAISHGNAVAFLHWALETFSPEELKGTLAATSLNFDLSVFELFAPLSSGGAVVVARNALHLAELPTASHVTLVNTVPSAMAQLLRLGAVPPSVRVINLAGEALPETLARQVYAVPTIEKLFNLYGPSEDTTYSTASLVGRDEV
ncbi:non-ribosomal peptide synthase/polyketide synthase, partial [Corallococcus sp. AS-1-12]|uniref:non-ribosomal peptide synthetase n=1 Tax=Corallococcus sp. AS-1-12 TaxID=2874598 RepID=UPI001CBFD78F